MAHNSLARIFPFPRPITIGDRDWFIMEAQIRHLAFLQAFIESKTPHPYFSVNTGPNEGESQESYRSRVQQAYSESERWKPTCDQETAEKIGQSELMALILGMALRRNKPAPNRDACLELMVQLNDVQWGEILGIFFARDLDLCLLRLIDPEIGCQPRDADDMGLSWREAVAKLVNPGMGLGMTFREVSLLYYSQWNTIWSGGKDEEYEFAVQVDMSSVKTPEDMARALVEASRKQRMKVYGSADMTVARSPLEAKAEHILKQIVANDPFLSRHQTDKPQAGDWVYPKGHPLAPAEATPKGPPKPEPTRRTSWIAS